MGREHHPTGGHPRRHREPPPPGPREWRPRPRAPELPRAIPRPSVPGFVLSLMRGLVVTVWRSPSLRVWLAVILVGAGLLCKPHLVLRLWDRDPVQAARTCIAELR